MCIIIYLFYYVGMQDPPDVLNVLNGQSQVKSPAVLNSVRNSGVTEEVGNTMQDDIIS